MLYTQPELPVSECRDHPQAAAIVPGALSTDES